MRRARILAVSVALLAPVAPVAVSAGEVIAYVRATPGAIGYISGTAPKSVKLLAKF